MMGRRIAAVLVLALVGAAAERAAAKEAVKEELAAEQVRTGVHTKKDPRLDGIVHPLDESADEKEFFWFNEVTGESAWELPVVEMEQEDENGEVSFYYLDTKTKEIFEEPPERWAWMTYTEKETNRPYYHNSALKLTQWEKPDELAWVRKHGSKFYWHNTVTDDVQWETPPDVRHSSDEEPEQFYYVVDGEVTWESPHGWEARVDDKSGDPYYHNTHSEESSWVKPIELGWVKVHVDFDDAVETEL